MRCPGHDEAAALAIQTFSPKSQLSPAQVEALNTITEALSSTAPFIEDLHALFNAYSTLYFRSLLQSTTTLTWSKRMTSCAGVCALLIDKATNRPKDPRECAVRLSEPLLKYRPRSDTLNTLLHESIHAYLFIAGGKHARGDDPTGHGNGFQRLASAINAHGIYNVTTTHMFHDEVQSYQTHVWQCTGSCKSLPPFFGIVRRAMNRPPGPSDNWYLDHQARCDGGTWVKISEPPPKEKKGVQKTKIDRWVKKGTGNCEGQSKDVGSLQQKPDGSNKEENKANGEGGEERKALLLEGSSTAINTGESIVQDTGDESIKLKTEVMQNKKRTELGGNGRNNEQKKPSGKRRFPADNSTASDTFKRPKVQNEDAVVVGTTKPQANIVECPVCPQHVPEADINSHLDIVHGF
ncbi:hypothetical protein K440DRAFT_661819 [Wilcoxina mikolae CBS 423.85]|nr:hypothetical protein K440DRAFT_661819 [Wilcoxina mikolae CBS 423.85]